MVILKMEIVDQKDKPNNLKQELENQMIMQLQAKLLLKKTLTIKNSGTANNNI